MLFAIRAETAKPGREKEKKKRKLSFDDLLQKISAEEYRDFIRQYAARDKEFKAEFELYFAAKDEKIDVSKQYETLIRRIISKYSERGFVDYSATFSLSKEIGRLLDTALAQVKKKQFSQAFALARVALREMMEVVMTCDDSAGNIGATVNDVIELLEAIADESSIPPAVMEELYGFIKAELSDNKYFSYGDFGYELFGLFRRLSVELDNEEEFLSFIDTQLSKPKEKYGDYRRDFYKREKIDFLKETGRKGEAEKLVQQNLDIVELRQEEIAKAIKKKDLDAAKKLIADGIKIAEKKGHPGTVAEWEKELLRIAVLEKDKETIRFYTKQFAFDRWSLSRDYYQQWKKTFTAVEWKEEFEKLVADKTEKVSKEVGKWKSHRQGEPYHSLLHELAPIYIEEKLWDRLLELVVKANDFDTAWRYHDLLVKNYPLELLHIYLPSLEQQGDKTTQRSDYADLVYKMKKIIKDIPQDAGKIKAVAQRLKEKYPRRPAMVEELNKILK